ncbi:MAG TPA: DUF4276 family protein [Polyangia bacterium]|nr:DUF4276 family protein [Polyangia bacterium]
MRVLIESLLPRLFPWLEFLCVTHEGKQDLDKSIPRKLRGWKVPGDRFVIVRDNDGGDCRLLKQRIALTCREAGRGDTLIRLPCQELEAWYFGDPSAVARAYEMPKLEARIAEAAGLYADEIFKPSTRLKEILPEFQKISGARRIAPHLSLEENGSRSFHAFIEGIRRIAGAPENE